MDLESETHLLTRRLGFSMTASSGVRALVFASTRRRLSSLTKQGRVGGGLRLEAEVDLLLRRFLGLGRVSEAVLILRTGEPLVPSPGSLVCLLVGLGLGLVLLLLLLVVFLEHRLFLLATGLLDVLVRVLRRGFFSVFVALALALALSMDFVLEGRRF